MKDRRIAIRDREAEKKKLTPGRRHGRRGKDEKERERKKK